MILVHFFDVFWSGKGPRARDQWTGPRGGPVDRAQGPGPVDRALGPGPVDRAQGPGPVDRAQGPGPVDRAQGPGPVDRAQGPGPVARAQGPGQGPGPSRPTHLPQIAILRCRGIGHGDQGRWVEPGAHKGAQVGYQGALGP